MQISRSKQIFIFQVFCHFQMVLKVRQVFRGKRLELSRTDLFTLASIEFLLSTGKSRQCSGGKITAPAHPRKTCDCCVRKRTIRNISSAQAGLAKRGPLHCCNSICGLRFANGPRGQGYQNLSERALLDLMMRRAWKGEAQWLIP
jgi:hypothetical protein